MSDQTQRAIDAKRKHEESWMRLDEVVAVGVGMDDNQPAIIISVKAAADDIRRQIPSRVEGVKVVIRQTGEIKAQ